MKRCEIIVFPVCVGIVSWVGWPDVGIGMSVLPWGWMVAPSGFALAFSADPVCEEPY